MTVNDVCTLFKIPNSPGSQIILPGNATVPVETFTALFSTAPAVPTYAQLIAIDNSVLGYKPFLDSCKTKGLIN